MSLSFPAAVSAVPCGTPHRVAWGLHQEEVPDPNEPGIEEIFPTMSRCSFSALLNTAPGRRCETAPLTDEAGGDYKLALFEHHAEDEFTAGVYGTTKHDRTAIVDGAFDVRLVIEAQDVQGLRVHRSDLPYAEARRAGPPTPRPAQVGRTWLDPVAVQQRRSGSGRLPAWNRGRRKGVGRGSSVARGQGSCTTFRGRTTTWQTTGTTTVSVMWLLAAVPQTNRFTKS